MMTDKVYQILVVDDHQMVVEGMNNLLGKIDHVRLAASSGNALEAMDVLRKTNIDIAFVDINMPEINGMELCLKIKAEFPHIHVIALSAFVQRSYVSQMIQNGASGYLSKSSGKEEIEDAIHSVLDGRIYISKEVSAGSFNSNANEEPPALTRREKEILQLIGEGLTNNEIAEKIFVSTYTVDTHRKNLLSKFGVNNTATLIKKAAGFELL
jgi:DNA-binding NarL/FixJ family response regulator